MFSGQIDQICALGNGRQLISTTCRSVVPAARASMSSLIWSSGIREAVSCSTHEALVGVYANTMIMLISCAHDPQPIVQRVLKRLESRKEGSRVAVALTPPRIDRIEDYAANYQTGVRTTQLRLMADGGGLIDLRTLPLTSLLLVNSTVPDQLRRFAEQLVEPLESHDQRRETELVNTLRTWLLQSFSAAATADRLMVHVNTVGYRLSKIQAILGRDLRKSDVRLELQLALHVWDILHTRC
ncbi:hypothetical protein AFM11_11140 [Mycolicibacterium wolinskyi]|uniref:PucR C-terminal helix-turn-helix domain-containing protein n=2 Tax=Mycolicibacterium wolinskyi TaxID=59750 RepID=A0A132PNS5_9MYCO|nr:hypothetical protein AFM11_11140 [Mycolicibacterium wolinskyi]